MVVGAGPAGSAVARDIARAGFKVALLEDHPGVGHPVRCSGLVTPRTLELAGVPDGVRVRPIAGALVHSASGQELALDGGRVQAVVIDRARFDEELVRQAQEAGAELLLAARVVGLERSFRGRRGIQVRAERGGRALLIQARLLVGADGASSSVARWLGRDGAPEMVSCVSAPARLRVSPPDFVQVFVGPSLAPGWFAWVIPAQEGWVRLGLGTTNGHPPAHLLRRLVEAFPRAFAGMEVAELRGGLIPLGLPRRLHADNTLLVGDAACQAKPTSGGGIYSSLVAARHCAGTAIEALERDDFSERALASYRARWLAEVGEGFRQGLDLRRAFLRLSDRDIDALLSLFRRPEFQRLIAQHGDIDFPGHLFGLFLQAMPLLQGMLHLPPGLWPKALGMAWRWRHRARP